MGSLTRKLRAASGVSSAPARQAHENARWAARRARNRERALETELARRPEEVTHPIPDLLLLDSPPVLDRLLRQTDREMSVIALGGSIGWDAFDRTIQEADDAILVMALGQSSSEPHRPELTAADLQLLSPEPPLDLRNRPAEQLMDLQERLELSAGGMAIAAAGRPGVTDLCRAATERDIEIAKARQAAELGAVVHEGAVMSPEDAARARLGLPPPRPRASRLLSLLMCAGLAVSSGLPPRGSR